MSLLIGLASPQGHGDGSLPARPPRPVSIDHLLV
jgi:hypothetical protein